MINYYRYRYYLNARHYFTGHPENTHGHTFEIALYVKKEQDNFLSFQDADRLISEYFSRYDNQLLNDLEEFRDINPTCENMGDFFYEQLRTQFRLKRLHLVQLSISETPIRSYLISDELLLSPSNSKDTNDKWEMFMNYKRKLEELEVGL